jgi:hypothetical protein
VQALLAGHTHLLTLQRCFEGLQMHAWLLAWAMMGDVEVVLRIGMLLLVPVGFQPRVYYPVQMLRGPLWNDSHVLQRLFLELKDSPRFRVWVVLFSHIGRKGVFLLFISVVKLYRLLMLQVFMRFWWLIGIPGHWSILLPVCTPPLLETLSDVFESLREFIIRFSSSTHLHQEIILFRVLEAASPSHYWWEEHLRVTEALR